MRQYPRAAAMYKIAIDRAPWWTAARNGLGLALHPERRRGRCPLTCSNAAHALDPFNHATTNYLRLLDDLMKFARKETAHFVVFYDAKKDPVIPEYFGDYLESIYRDVCGEYQHGAAGEDVHRGLPDARCVQRAHDRLAVDRHRRREHRPRDRDGRPAQGHATMGAFNWSQVLRHEFTHTVTLAATDNRIAHWMTEGLAVVEEHAPLRWEWVPMLYHAVKKKQLFTMENLTWGFVRPKRPIDRQLAYAESFWICTYIEEKWGHDSILKMLAEFKKGREQRDVFPEILGKT